MKKVLLSFALVLTAAAAFAQSTAFATYDYDNQAGSAAVHHEVMVGASYATTYGKFDAAVVGDHYNPGTESNALGFELGYSNGFGLSTGTVTGRVALGRKDQTEFSNTQYYSIAAEYSLPITQTVSGFVGIRHRNTFDTDVAFVENRFTVGADFALTKAVSARVGLSHTYADGASLNGVTTAISYQF